MAESFWSHEATLPPLAASASESRHFVRSHLSSHALPDLCDDVELVASELSTNVIRHAGTEFTMSLQGDGASVLLTVHDRGPGGIPTPTTLPDWSAPGGRGLLIAGELSDTWGITRNADGRTVVWACFGVRSPVT